MNNLLLNYITIMNQVSKKNKLPPGYTQVEYLENRSIPLGEWGHTYPEGWINTNISIETGYCIELEFKLLTYDESFCDGEGGAGIAGVGDGYSAAQGFGFTGEALRFYITPEENLTPEHLDLDTWYNIKFSASEDNCFLYLDDTLVYNYDSITLTPLLSVDDRNKINLFYTLSPSGHAQAFVGAIRKCKIYNESTVANTMPTTPIAEYIFCKRDSDDAYGVYDIISKTFIEATGTLYSNLDDEE